MRVYEDNIGTADITYPSEKIEYIWGHIKPDSATSTLLAVSAFTDLDNLNEAPVDVLGGCQLGGPLA